MRFAAPTGERGGFFFPSMFVGGTFSAAAGFSLGLFWIKKSGLQ